MITASNRVMTIKMAETASESNWLRQAGAVYRMLRMAQFMFPRRMRCLALAVTLAVGLCAGSASADPRDKERWDSKYAQDEFIYGKEPIPFLKEQLHLLPKGRALDLAMGQGRNGVYLATQGFQVTGLDISEKGLAMAQKLAEERRVTIDTQVVDLETAQLGKDAYDVVLCIYYLQRSLFPRMKEAIKNGGTVLVETYTLDHAKYNPKFPKDYLLQPNELLEQFKEFKILRYQAVDDGKSAYASILAQKP
jgi:tellurite methyltransferase